MCWSGVWCLREDDMEIFMAEVDMIRQMCLVGVRFRVNLSWLLGGP